MTRPLYILRQHSIALIALFVALGGTGYAATQLPRNSVGSSQIRDHAIRPADISQSVRNELRGPQGAQGPAGPAGPSGPTIERPAGQQLRTHIVDASTLPVGAASPGAVTTLRVPCPRGERAVGGGANPETTADFGPADSTLEASFPYAENGIGGWQVVYNVQTRPGGAAKQGAVIHGYAVCAPAQSL
jgi:hypothetical protein